MKWEYLAPALFLIYLLLATYIHYEVVQFIPETKRYSYFDLTAGQYIFAALTLLLLFMIVWAALDLYQKKKWIERLLFGICLSIALAFFVASAKPSLNIVLDRQQKKYERISVVAYVIEHRPRRKFSDYSALDVQVRLPDTNELIQFECKYSAKINASDAPKFVSFTLGRGFFGDAYVIDIVRFGV